MNFLKLIIVLLTFFVMPQTIYAEGDCVETERYVCRGGLQYLRVLERIEIPKFSNSQVHQAILNRKDLPEVVVFGRGAFYKYYSQNCSRKTLVEYIHHRLKIRYDDFYRVYGGVIPLPLMDSFYRDEKLELDQETFTANNPNNCTSGDFKRVVLILRNLKGYMIDLLIKSQFLPDKFDVIYLDTPGIHSTSNYISSDNDKLKLVVILPSGYSGAHTYDIDVYVDTPKTFVMLDSYDGPNIGSREDHPKCKVKGSIDESCLDIYGELRGKALKSSINNFLGDGF